VVKGSKLVPTEESYFMGKLLIEAAACRDPGIQRAALIVDKKDVISFGYSSILTEYPTSAGSWADRDYAMYSAEDMALDKAISCRRERLDFISVQLFVLNPPTHHSLLRCLSLGIKTIIYMVINDQFIDQADWKKAQHLAKERRMTLKEFDGNLNWIRDRLLKYDYLF